MILILVGSNAHYLIIDTIGCAHFVEYRSDKMFKASVGISEMAPVVKDHNGGCAQSTTYLAKKWQQDWNNENGQLVQRVGFNVYGVSWDIGFRTSALLKDYNSGCTQSLECYLLSPLSTELCIKPPSDWVCPWGLSAQSLLERHFQSRLRSIRAKPHCNGNQHQRSIQLNLGGNIFFGIASERVASLHG